MRRPAPLWILSVPPTASTRSVKTDDSRPVRRPRRAQPPAASTRPPGLLRLGHGALPRRNLRATALARTPELDRRLKVEPAREKRERVAASLREDTLPHALVEWPFGPILPRSCCWAERKARARALLDDRESLSKGRAAQVNLSSCSPVLSSRTYVDVATVVHFNASPFTRIGRRIACASWAEHM